MSTTTRAAAALFTYENNGGFCELEDADGVLSALGDVDVDADLGQVLDPDGHRRHEVRVQPGVVAEHVPPQVDRLEDEGDGAGDGEGQESADGGFLWRSIHQAFFRQSNVSVQQPIGEEVNQVEAEHDEKEEGATGGALLRSTAGAAQVYVCGDVGFWGNKEHVVFTSRDSND